MESKTIAVSVDDLEIGMYVTELDRPWLETPYLLQGFTVQSGDDILKLKQHCEFVYIDEWSLPSKFVALHEVKITVMGAQSLDAALPQRKQKRYEVTADLSEEVAKAKVVKDELETTVKSIFRDMTSNKQLDIAVVQKAVTPMIDSIIRNPDAMIWLARLKSRDSYTYKHTMGASIWAVVLGRQLGLPRSDLKDLATGTMLCDVGKIKLDQNLLSRPGKLSEAEFETVKQHVDFSLEFLKHSINISENIRLIVANHHERMSGKGYPNGYKGNDIPVFARIAAIADCYDAMTL